MRLDMRIHSVHTDPSCKIVSAIPSSLIRYCMQICVCEQTGRKIGGLADETCTEMGRRKYGWAIERGLANTLRAGGGLAANGRGRIPAPARSHVRRILCGLVECVLSHSLILSFTLSHLLTRSHLPVALDLMLLCLGRTSVARSHFPPPPPFRTFEFGESNLLC
jgi:hypothetical protein